MAKKAVKEESEKRRPDFVARCRQSPDSDFYLSIGAAWKTDVNGQQGFSVRLTNLPIQFDGSFLLLTPLPERE